MVHGTPRLQAYAPPEFSALWTAPNQSKDDGQAAAVMCWQHGDKSFYLCGAPGSQLSHVSGSKSQFWAPQRAVPFCCPGTEISSWFFAQSIITKKKKKKISMKEAAGKYIPVHQSAVKVVVVEGPFWKNLMVRKGVLNLMIKCSTAVLCHCSKNTADAQNISGNCFKMVEFAEMKGGETDTKLSVSCTCLVYLFALLTINCFPNLC